MPDGDDCEYWLSPAICSLGKVTDDVFDWYTSLRATFDECADLVDQHLNRHLRRSSAVQDAVGEAEAILYSMSGEGGPDGDVTSEVFNVEEFEAIRPAAESAAAAIAVTVERTLAAADIARVLAEVIRLLAAEAPPLPETHIATEIIPSASDPPGQQVTASPDRPTGPPCCTAAPHEWAQTVLLAA